MKCIIIGNGKMAIDCYKMLLNNNWEIEYIISSPSEDLKGSSFQKFLLKSEISFDAIEKINSFDFAHFDEKKIDVVFTINSYKVLKNKWLEISRLGVVNFHNSLLPNYKGVNIPYWVIQNGEKTHGTTWHFINKDLDMGKVIYQEEFDLVGDETNARLTNLCIKKGIENFPIVLDLLKNLKNQDGLLEIGEGSCYYYKDKAINDGEINFNWNYLMIEKIVRALNYLPYPNDFQYSYFYHNGKKVIVNKVNKIKERENQKIGSFAGETEKGKPILVCKDMLFSLEECMTEDIKLLETKDIFN